MTIAVILPPSLPLNGVDDVPGARYRQGAVGVDANHQGSQQGQCKGPGWGRCRHVYLFQIHTVMSAATQFDRNSLMHEHVHLMLNYWALGWALVATVDAMHHVYKVKPGKLRMLQ